MEYLYKDVGIFSFGTDIYSLFEQVASEINYKAFSYYLLMRQLEDLWPLGTTDVRT